MRSKVATWFAPSQYGLIWIFPGDPALSEERKIPEIPELEGPNPWASVRFSFFWNAHDSIIFDNVGDMTHEYLHREFNPFVEPKLRNHVLAGDAVTVTYDARMVQEGFIKHLIDGRTNTNEITMTYEYPYQWSNIGGQLKHYACLLPVDERATRIFFLLYVNLIRVPFTLWSFPYSLRPFVLEISKRLFMQPLLREDGEAVAWEQEEYERLFDAPLAELKPAVPLFEELTVRKWEEHLSKDTIVGRSRNYLARA